MRAAASLDCSEESSPHVATRTRTTLTASSTSHPRHHRPPPPSCSAEHVSSLVPGVLQDDFVAKQPHKAWKRNDGGHGRVTLHPFKHPHDNKAQDLAVSIPDSVDTVDELLTRTETRWIFTPSFKRYLRGPRQALLDRSEALPPPLDGLDVGRR